MSVLAASTATKLEPFLLLAKSAKSAACAQLIQDALAAPGVFVFGELLDVPSVRELENSEQHSQHFRLLSIFAYGTVQDYKANQASLPALTPQQLKKLRQLTIATLSSRSRVLGYDLLLEVLDIDNLRELEDLIIDAIYQNIISGKLDQRKKCLVVEFAMGRDVKPDQVHAILGILREWLATSENILTQTENKIQSVRDEALARQADADNFQRQLEDAKSRTKATAAQRPRRSDFDMGGIMLSDDRDDHPRTMPKRKGKDGVHSFRR
ncbi:hypothetical protein HK105_200724 [Polyrhizophydium stewartii]|uniref:PCI domain-containing protein n=1 Tax=Polyrhizophydium stewartii TaxID=2732419 RepID=A0ABR4NJT8_9FUNG